MTESVELRIHGIGRHSAQKILGQSVQLDGAKHLYRRVGEAPIYAMLWSRLTRTGIVAFSFLLLPFALVNAAWFMQDPTDSNSVHRATVSIIGVTTSAAWILWGILIFWDLPMQARSPTQGFIVRAVGSLVAVLITWRVVVDLTPVRSSRLGLSPVRRELEVERPSWTLHYIIVAVLVVFCILRGKGGDALCVLTAIQLTGLGFFGLLTREGGTASQLLSTDTAFIACALSHVGGYSVAQIVAMVMVGELRGDTFFYPEGIVAGKAEPGIDGVFVFWLVALMAWALVGAVAMILRRLSPTGTLGAPDFGRTDSLIISRWTRWKYRMRLRRVARPPLRPRTSWLLAILVTLVFVVPLFLYWKGLTQGEPPILYEWPWMETAVFLGIAALVIISILTTMSVVGQAALARAFDILGFLPRQFHPWSPCFYADKAVKEIEASIALLARQAKLVWVVGHSQGSVLAFTALAGMEGSTLRRCRLITCGSPLNRLYGNFFPSWFTGGRFLALADKMGAEQKPVWWNFYRRTDYISGPLNVDSSAVADFALGEPEVESGLPHAKVLGHSGYWDEPRIAELVRGDGPQASHG